MNTEIAEPIYSVSQLNSEIRDFLENQVMPLWITGEISNFACPSSGHWYFTLKDAQASIRCALFKPKSRGITVIPENGAQVLLHGRVSLYTPRGDYQFIADYLEAAGDGLLQKKFNLLKEKLLQEGLFEAIHKKPIPKWPSTIGVVTSPTGAAIHDILHVLNRRFPMIKIIIYPTSVQGASAAAEITQAINTANQQKLCDVLIVGRGGGSLEDLWPFNEESVARAIFNSELPIVSAVGHEVDTTIADFVADLRAPTPSAAAELLSPDQTELNNILEKMTARLKNLLNQTSRNITQQLDHFEQKIKRAMQNLLQEKKLNLLELSRALNTMSPLGTLDRGYALLLDKDNNVLSSIKDVKVGEKITAQVKDGKISATVI
ncbi:MAG TPA: exodeoxyribonuclease VII large subunit [Gammaproteobacteria bacterium]|nr:exodeoxyribonuclease VII large subunit [Gammaproteobacteria bacterium]